MSPADFHLDMGLGAASAPFKRVCVCEMYDERTVVGDMRSESAGDCAGWAMEWVEDITDERAVVGDMSDAADDDEASSERLSMVGGNDGGMSSAGFGKVLYVEPREV